MDKIPLTVNGANKLQAELDEFQKPGRMVI